MLIRSMSIAATGLNSFQKVVDNHSANIANADTPGYRRRDSHLSEVSNGGVAHDTVHRFNIAVAVRITELAANAKYSDTLAEKLVSAQDLLGSASKSMADSQVELKTALTQMIYNPSNPAASTATVEKASAFAKIANNYLSQIEGKIADEDKFQDYSKQLASIKAAELAALNRSISQIGWTPEIKDKQAQTAKELSELTGGVVSFTSAGVAEFSINGNPLVNAEGVQPFGTEFGGAIGASIQAKAELEGINLEFRDQLNNFSSGINTLNSAGSDLQGNVGQDLFGFDAQGNFVYTGNSFAINGSNQQGNSLVEALNFSKGITDLTGKTAIKASLANTLSSVDGQILNSMESERVKQEGVNIDMEILGMTNAKRAYEANAKVIQTADSMLGTLLSIKA